MDLVLPPEKKHTLSSSSSLVAATASTKVVPFQTVHQKTSPRHRIKKNFVIGDPQRYQRPQETKQLSSLLLKLNKDSLWTVKGVGHYTDYIRKKDVSGDAVHVTEVGMKVFKRQIGRNILKEMFFSERDGEKTVCIQCETTENQFCLCGNNNPS